MNVLDYVKPIAPSVPQFCPRAEAKGDGIYRLLV